MWKELIGAILALVGLIFLFDARRIVKKNFASADENSTVLGVKIFGSLMAIFGGILTII